MAIVVRPGHQHVQRVADQQLGLGVDARRRLVEHEDARIEGERAGERQQLLLADRERGAALGDRRSRTRRGSRSMNRSACTASAARCTASSAIADSPSRMLAAIVPREQVHVLQHEAEEPPQLVQVHLAHVDAVDEDAARASRRRTAAAG